MLNQCAILSAHHETILSESVALWVVNASSLFIARQAKKFAQLLSLIIAESRTCRYMALKSHTTPLRPCLVTTQMLNIYLNYPRIYRNTENSLGCGKIPMDFPNIGKFLCSIAWAKEIIITKHYRKISFEFSAIQQVDFSMCVDKYLWAANDLSDTSTSGFSASENFLSLAIIFLVRS